MQRVKLSERGNLAKAEGKSYVISVSVEIFGKHDNLAPRCLVEVERIEISFTQIESVSYSIRDVTDEVLVALPKTELPGVVRLK